HPSLIEIFLKSFSDHLSKVNISLGYPLVYSPARSLAEWIIEVWEDVIQLEGKVERKRLTRLWSHIYMRQYFKSEGIQMSGEKQLYFQRDHWKEDNVMLETLFDPDRDGFNPLTSMIDIVEILIPVQADAFHREILRYTRGRLIRVRDVLESMEKL